MTDATDAVAYWEMRQRVAEANRFPPQLRAQIDRDLTKARARLMHMTKGEPDRAP